jgi:hypothetical protein
MFLFNGLISSKGTGSSEFLEIGLLFLTFFGKTLDQVELKTDKVNFLTVKVLGEAHPPKCPKKSQ